MPTKNEALNLEAVTEDSEIVKEYKELGQKCEDVIKKIRTRKSRKEQKTS